MDWFKKRDKFDKEMMLPVIDFSSQELKPGSSTWEAVKLQVKTALEEYHCFHALCSENFMETHRKLYDCLPELFGQPLEDIARNNPDIISEYYRPDIGKPHFEVIKILEATLPTKVNNLTSSIWPQGNSKFSKAVQCHVDLVSKLDETIRMMVLESLGLERYKEEHRDSTEYVLAFNEYKAPPANVTEVRLHSHTDNGLVTILDQHGIDALEVQMKDDDQWIKVNFCPNSLFVIIGDTFHALTNGRLHATDHRVTMSGKESRHVVALFSTPKQGYIVKAVEELVDENHTQLYKPFDFYEYMDFFRKNGPKYKVTLKDYAGV